MKAAELLESLNLLDEHERIEAKRASEPGKSILETVCAFANEPGLSGGWLLLGVVRDDVALLPAYEVEGVDQPEKLGTEIATQCRSIFNQPVRVEISSESIHGKTILVVHVPEAQPQDKPVFFRAQGLPRGAFRRISSTDQHCTDDDMAVFYQGRQQESFDSTLVVDTTLDDLLPEAIADYRQSRAEAAVLDDLPKGFALEEGKLQREDKPAIPLRVIREALVNALMHRSYRSHSPVQIIRYANRLEIRNPGFSLKSQDHLGEPGSQLRNPRIAAALYDIRLAETKGSGIRVMRESMEQAGLTPPLFESDRGNDQFVARYFFHHFLGEDDIAWLAQFRDVHLCDEEAKALIVVREAGAIDNATYRELNKVDALAASGALRRLRDAGLLAQKGRGSATYYGPTERLGADGKGLSGKPLSLSGSPDGLSTNPSALSTNPSALSTNPSALSTNPSALSTKYTEEEENLRKNLLDQLPGTLAAQIGAIGQRNPPGEVCDVIVEICRQRACRADELATLVRRHPRYVRSNYLRPLIRDGRLAMTNPDEPNDPQQAYRALGGTHE